MNLLNFVKDKYKKDNDAKDNMKKLFIWGVPYNKSDKPSLNTANKICLLYNLQFNNYELHLIERHFGSVLNEVKYYSELLRSFTDFMHTNNYDTHLKITPEKLFAGVGVTSYNAIYKSIEEAYSAFKFVVDALMLLED